MEGAHVPVVRVDNENDEGNLGSDSRKRPRGSPTLLTPHRREKRIPLREINSTIDESTARSTGDTLAPKQLFTPCSNSLKEKWSSAESKALVEFVLFHCTGELWPTHKQMGFWETASTFVASRSDSIACRSELLHLSQSHVSVIFQIRLECSLKPV